MLLASVAGQLSEQSSGLKLNDLRLGGNSSSAQRATLSGEDYPRPGHIVIVPCDTDPLDAYHENLFQDRVAFGPMPLEPL